MSCNDYLKAISNRFASCFSEISAEYNFDYGDEFEIALCKGLRAMLPSKYGVCRGFIVASTGEFAGDDIIIYDQNSFPALRLLDNRDFAQKQQIPAEAVYAYIEAKHTLVLEGQGGQSLARAREQIEAVKSLKRECTPLLQIGPYTKLNVNAPQDPLWPSYRNPLYTMIASRYIRIREHGQTDQLETVLPILRGLSAVIAVSGSASPDVIIAGSHIVCLPAVRGQLNSPFFLPGVSSLAVNSAIDRGFGVGLSMLSWAIDWIILGPVYWPAIIAAGLDVPLDNDLRSE